MTSSPDLLTAGRAKLLAAAESIQPVLEADADEAESLRALPASSVQALTDSGLLHMSLPRDLGGDEADLVTQILVIEKLAYTAAAAGWCQMIGATAIATLGAFLPDRDVAEVFAESPRAAMVFAPGGRAVPADGGYQISGHWKFASGVLHSQWLALGVLVPEEGARDRHLMLAVPIESVTIVDNWNTIGLRGTGSCDVTTQDVHIPRERVFDFVGGTAQRGGALYRLGTPAGVAYQHAAFAVGVARRVLDTVTEMAPDRKRGIPPTPISERSSFHRELGELDLELRAARAFAIECNAAAWEAASRGQEVGRAQQSELRASATYATDVALRVVTRAYQYTGGSALYQPNVLERAVRDLHTASQHYMVSSIAYEHHARSLLGFEDVNPRG